jgi:hypothetical protein
VILDWDDVLAMSVGMTSLVVDLSPQSRAILWGVVASGLPRSVWLYDTELPTDAQWDDIEAALALLSGELQLGVGEAGVLEMAQWSHYVSSGVSGGSAAANTWNVRVLNWDGVQQAWATRNGDVITLEQGLYWLQLVQSAYQTGHTRGGLYVNVGGLLTTIEGVWDYVDVSANVEQTCVVDWSLSVSETATVGARLYTQLAKVGNGMGVGVVGVNNRFAVLTIVRLGDVA